MMNEKVFEETKDIYYESAELLEAHYGGTHGGQNG